MALSNTATPRYYGEFRDAVLRGEIPVNEKIEMEMNRIDALIQNPGVYYDDKAIDGFIAYCEKELVLTNGDDLHLLDSFKLWAEWRFRRPRGCAGAGSLRQLKNNIKIKAGTHPEKPEMRACFVMLLQLRYCGKTSCDVPNI